MINLSEAIVYDIETMPNCFTFAMEMLNSDQKAVWEISEFRNDANELFTFLNYLNTNQAPMIGFNNIHFDYPVIHKFWKNPGSSYTDLYNEAMKIIESKDRFSHVIWADDRLAPQIDLFKINHFDNVAKSTSLKALQVNMRSPFVLDMPVENGSILTKEQIDNVLIPYNFHDVSETKRFAQYTIGTVDFRNSLIDKFGIDVLNWNDTKIGEKMIIKELGDDTCYDYESTGTGYSRRKMRQSPRSTIALKDIIFPYIKFQNSEFNRIHQYLKTQTLKADDIKTEGESAKIVTKGVFKDLIASVGGINFHFGVGGIHASMERKRVIATEEWLIRDIDVASLYPSIAIKNNLSPEHLGQRFVEVYSQLPVERKKWQAAKGKKCAEANSYKLASNGAYGKSNSNYSPLYDPKFTMTITINGQLLLAMLAEKLVEIPTIQLIQANTDGITYYIHRDYEPLAAQVCKEWEEMTLLTLEDADYKSMFIRDVNNYIAVDTDSNVKLKGAYWTPDPMNFHESIANSQPPAWYKNFSNVASVRAAVNHMIYGIDIEQLLRTTLDPYDFCCAVKIKKSDKLFWGEQEQQKNTRFYISTDGAMLKKVLPAKGPVGQYKKANGISDRHYNQVMQENGGQWDESVCTKNKSKYEIRESSIMTGYNVTVCNDMKDFDFNNIHFDWYLQEALKLVI